MAGFLPSVAPCYEYEVALNIVQLAGGKARTMVTPGGLSDLLRQGFIPAAEFALRQQSGDLRLADKPMPKIAPHF